METYTHAGIQALRARLDRDREKYQQTAHRGVLSGQPDSIFYGGKTKAMSEAIAHVTAHLHHVGWQHRQTKEIVLRPKIDPYTSAIEFHGVMITQEDLNDPNGLWDALYKIDRYIPGYW